MSACWDEKNGRNRVSSKALILHLNYHNLGYDITAFLGIYLSKSSKY